MGKVGVECWLSFVVGSLHSFLFSRIDLQDNTPDEQEEKARLITQVLELQNTLDGNISHFYIATAVKL